jgi:phospholipid transport system substrate-binding protein
MGSVGLIWMFPIEAELGEEDPMRRLLSHLVLVLVFAVGLQIRPALAQSDPRAFMNDIGTRVLKIINDKQTPEAERKAQFRQLAEGAFDVPSIARFVLGRYWRTASDEEKKNFTQAFETYMISVYWSRFTSYNGESFRVSAARDDGNDNTTVTTEIMRTNGQPPVKVSWSIVKSGNGLKILDASLEGISQRLTYRDEFASVIERNNGQVSALIKQLNDRAKG